MISDIKFSIVNEWVDSDLKAMQQNRYDDIIRKMRMVSSDRLDSILGMLNLGVIDNMISKEEKQQKEEISVNQCKIIKIY